MLVPYCFDYCSFVICFEIRKCEASDLFIFLKIVLAIRGPLWFHKDFRIVFSLSVKKCPWNFDRDCIESIDHFWVAWTF